MSRKKETETAAEATATADETIVDEETTATAAAEATYTVEEFAAAATSVFGAKPDIVVAALRSAGVTSTSKSKAIEIVNKYRNKEV